MAIKLSTGKIAFPIEFDNGDVQNIYFNPNDPELATRLITAKERIAEKIKGVGADDIKLSNNGEPLELDEIKDISALSDEEIKAITEKAESFSKIVSQTKAVICEELDTAFDSNISEVVFKYCSPFAIIDGNYFVLNFLEAITPEIKKCIKTANEDIKRKMQKHTSKYTKK